MTADCPSLGLQGTHFERVHDSFEPLSFVLLEAELSCKVLYL